MEIFAKNKEKLDLIDYDLVENYNLAFYLNALSVAGFPMEPVDVQEFSRNVQGLNVSMGVSNHTKNIKVDTARKEFDVFVEIPSGPEIRVIMCYIIYRIKRFKQKRIVLDSSFVSFLKTMGVKISYKKDGSFEKYLTALIQLCHTYMTVTDERKGSGDIGLGGDNKFIIEKYCLWWDENFENGDAFIEVNDNFYDFVQKKGSPVDWSVIRKINHSAFKLDIYFWMVTKTFSMNTNMQLFKWNSLYATFGLHHDNISEFKRKFRYELKSLCEKFDFIESRSEITANGLVVKNLGSMVPETKMQMLAKHNLEKIKV